MKLFSIIIALAFSHIAIADSFTIIRDNTEYRCESTTPSNPIGSIDCVDTAYRGPFTRDEAKSLCKGAQSTAPADCAIKAYAGRFTKTEAIQLCRSAKSNSPIDCANKAYSGPFSSSESISLCENNGSILNADCAIKAYAGPYSKAESVEMCKAQPQLVLRSLSLIEQSSDLKEKVARIKKAVNLK